ncbi:MAG: ROK family protein [Myxococcota bacterium]|nr:ROK family protein [Myxococcota bacterium]
MKHFTGVHITPNALRAALIREDFKFVKEGSWDMGPEQHTQDGLVAIIAEAVRTVDPGGSATANGVTLPGTLHRWEGRIDACPDVPAWVGLRLKEALEQKIGGHVMMDKESNCVTAGEVLRGQAGFHSDLIAVHMGRHIDGAIILHRHLWHGGTGMAGSVGHMVVDRDGPEAGDGTALRGTLNAYISDSAIAGRLKSRPVEGVDPASADLLIRLASATGPEAQEHLDAIGAAIATPVAGLINALDVRSILLSGIGQETYDKLAESVARGLASRVAPPLRDGITLVPATTGDNAALIGAGYNWLLQPHD